jgi:uncharacterized delta-60 repeat protein
VRITLDFDSRRGRRLIRSVAGLLALGAIAWPLWAGASQVTGLVTFAPGGLIKSADFNANFQALATAINDADSKVTTVTGQVNGQLGTQATAIANLQALVATLQNQNAALTQQLAGARFVEAASVKGVADPSFGGVGLAGAGIPNSDGLSCAVDGNNRIVVAGKLGTSSTMLLARFNPDGTLDASFGAGGLVNPTTAGGLGYSVAIDSSGRIVVAGQVTSPSPGGLFAMAVWRFNPDGSADTSFGANGVLIPPPPGTLDIGHSVTFDSSGRILVAGETTAGHSVVAVWRVTVAGALDATYGTGGVAIDPTPLGQGLSIVLDASGRAVVAGVLGNSMGVWRFTTAGMLDGTFGTGGSYASPLASAAGETVTLDASGRILVGGEEIVAGNPEMTVWRLTTGGVLDGTFAAGGLFVFGTAGSGAGGIQVDVAGRIVVGGASNGTNTVAVWRFTPDGALDASFGAGGVVTSIFPNPQYSVVSNGTVLDPTGGIVVAGEIGVGGVPGLAVFRFR